MFACSDSVLLLASDEFLVLDVSLIKYLRVGVVNSQCQQLRLFCLAFAPFKLKSFVRKL